MARWGEKKKASKKKMVIQNGQKDSLERKEAEFAQMCSGDKRANKRKHLVLQREVKTFLRMADSSPLTRCTTPPLRPEITHTDFNTIRCTPFSIFLYRTEQKPPDRTIPVQLRSGMKPPRLSCCSPPAVCEWE